MEVRERRGLEIAAKSKLARKGPLWIVPSQAGRGSYVVDRESGTATCTCPDFETRNDRCKHVFAVEFTMQRESTVNGTTVTETVRVTYKQEWSAYNLAQTHEKERVATLLHDLCAAIDEPPQAMGRPRTPSLTACSAP